MKHAAVIALACGLVAGPSSAALAGERYALVVTGASGGPEYAEKYLGWRSTFVTTLRRSFHYPADHIVVLGEDATSGVGRATRDGVRAALASLSKRLVKDDVLLVLLIGHGNTVDGEDAKFNLVGPDLDVDEWAALIGAVRGQVVFVNASSASFPFVAKLSAKGRIVLTATESPAQQFETMFAEFFVKAFADTGADLDKNGKVSIWEAFQFTSAGVKKSFEERGRLATERPVLDDTGDGRASDAESAAASGEGAIAKTTYLQPDQIIAVPGNAELTELLRRRAEIETSLEALRARKSTMPADEYEKELEAALLDLARIDRRIRTKT